ncbi:MAG: ATP-binding cassette domain-containing protein, partial [Acholeplasmataceae bacterium]|nr:ATP-binding cassette domain-containing protein [Acholeplasmataceae bacterium]
MISVQHISKSFGTKNKIQVLKNVSVKFPDKGLVVLLGHSGSGKTTFLNVIGGLDKASDGQILMDEIIVKNRSTQAWDQLRSRDIGYIFQNYHLIPTLSVFDNVAISLRIQGLKDELE